MEHRSVRIEIIVGWVFVAICLALSQISKETWGVNVDLVPFLAMICVSILTSRGGLSR